VYSITTEPFYTLSVAGNLNYGLRVGKCDSAEKCVTLFDADL
jgi:hypothetical protein